MVDFASRRIAYAKVLGKLSRIAPVYSTPAALKYIFLSAKPATTHIERCNRTASFKHTPDQSLKHLYQPCEPPSLWRTTSPPSSARSKTRFAKSPPYSISSPQKTNITPRSTVPSTTKSGRAATATGAPENTSSRRTRRRSCCRTCTRTQPTTPRTR